MCVCVCVCVCVLSVLSVAHAHDHDTRCQDRISEVRDNMRTHCHIVRVVMPARTFNHA